MAQARDFDVGTASVPAPDDWERRLRNAQTRARKVLWKARRNALRNAAEGLFVARGWSIRDAQQMAAWWVEDRLERAKSELAKYGFDYWTGTWRNA